MVRAIPETGFVRLVQVLAVIPVGKTCWWEGVKSGRFPRPVKISKRCTAWRAEDIHALIRSISDEYIPTILH
jgi:predicted DNA-binding transcriptional regulator AlpA